jgi:hypothetical protein
LVLLLTGFGDRYYGPREEELRPGRLKGDWEEHDCPMMV